MSDGTTDDGTVEQPDDSMGAQLKAWVGTISILPLVTLAPLLRVLPASWRLWHKLHHWAAWQMQKAAGADALANVRRPNDREDILPAAYVQGDEDGRDVTGWKVKGLGDKRYATGIRGGASSRMGKADLIHINEDDLEQGSWAEAAIDTAIATNREQYLFRDAELEAHFNVVPSAVGDDGALADGGQPEHDAILQEVTPKRPGVLEDVVVPVTSEGGYDGQQVSMTQFSNLKQEQSDQEQIRQAKNAGWMAAKLDEIGKGELFKWILIACVVGAVLLFHAEIGAFIAGLGGGGGGVTGATSGLGMMSPVPLGGV